MSKCKERRGRKYPPEILTTDEVGSLIRACGRRSPTGIRNQALIAVLYRSGLRISEALDLRDKDINLDQGALQVLHGKGDKSRIAGIDGSVSPFVRRWSEYRRKLGFNGQQPFFCTLKGEPMWDSYIRQLMPRLARRAGIEKRVHAHGLRHTHAAELCKEGIPLNVIQVQLGHSNAAVTSRYVAHIAPVEMIRTLQARHWEVVP